MHDVLHEHDVTLIQLPATRIKRLMGNPSEEERKRRRRRREEGGGGGGGIVVIHFLVFLFFFLSISTLSFISLLSIPFHFFPFLPLSISCSLNAHRPIYPNLTSVKSNLGLVTFVSHSLLTV